MVVVILTMCVNNDQNRNLNIKYRNLARNLIDLAEI